MAAETQHDLVAHGPASAAMVIQKTYRGYRARRKLADAAIMSKTVSWWNVVDSVVLQQHTLQYYAHSKSWKANDNWKRLKRKASKVGKGLEKNNKALKLALQHWLEAVDARHRYGHNLRPYYLHWHELDTNEPFFYWLDLGSGRQVELQKCSRATLHEQQITYLSPEQRRHYEVVIYHGKLYYQSSGDLVHTPDTDRWIFVMSPSYKLYIGKKQKGKFQHSSFLAGGATTAAGRLVVTHGVLKLMEAHSGHYRPSPENFEALVGILVNRGADLHMAKVQLVSDDLLEKKRAKELAKQVRHAVEGTCGNGHVEVKVENQSLISVDSGINDGASDYVVTNVTFPDYVEPGTANKTHLAAEDSAPVKSNEADAEVGKQQTVVTDHVSQPQQVKPTVQSNGIPEAFGDVQLPPELIIVKRIKPSALVLPVGSLLDDVGGQFDWGPKTATLPASPGFSRNSHLANLGPQERRLTLKRYGPRKIAFGTKPLETIPSEPLTC